MFRSCQPEKIFEGKENFDCYVISPYNVPGQRGFQEAEIHDSRKMSTLILRYAREHNMGKYTLVASNQLGTVESNCDLIVRKKQFPPVFWQRLYNVSGQADSTRFVGGVEVGGWPVPTVYWYRVLEDGEEVEVTTRTHTENWNGNPNKYVPSSKVEIRQIDQIRHQIIFNQVGEGYSGLYRVRAVNCLGEAECEAELSFDGEGGGGDEMYLPPLWREKRRLNWRDEDLRKKPFVGFNEPELSPEELEAMKKGSGLVPLSRITEYLASLPNYVPTNKFDQMERMPYKAGVDEHDYRPSRKGGSPRFPGKFEKGKIVHRNYNVDGTARILPKWQNKADPRSPNSADWRWAPVHPDLYEPQFPPRSTSPEPTPVWEKPEDISLLIKWLRSLGCRVTQVEISAGQENKQSLTAGTANTETLSQQGSSAVKKFSYIRDNKEEELKQKEKKKAKHAKQAALVDQQTQQSQQVHQPQEARQAQQVHQHQHQQAHQAQQSLQVHQTQQAQQTYQTQQTQQSHQTQTKQVSQNISLESQSQSASNVTTTYESRTSLQSQQTFQESESEYFTAEIAKPIYHKQENLSFPELDRISQPPPALPPKTKIMHSPSRKQ